MVKTHGLPYLNPDVYPYLSPLEELEQFARAKWGDNGDGQASPLWWHVNDGEGTVTGYPDGYVTNGVEYYVLLPDVVGVREIQFTGTLALWGSVDYSLRTETGLLQYRRRQVYW